MYTDPDVSMSINDTNLSVSVCENRYYDFQSLVGPLTVKIMILQKIIYLFLIFQMIHGACQTSPVCPYGYHATNYSVSDMVIIFMQRNEGW